ncbi:hypothetical protein CASFOL_011055 [Castilleja foliolosa]|uniref:CRC domain-containing protein n=1 Tax=Castilleja foliolosa TaxID=1961234 RepID=A0ABD3DUF7_9LAMI
MKMDSPESSKPTTTNCETAPVQDSPVFSFISNLSPIQSVRAPPVTQGFPELNSPPLVFTSPRLNRQRQSTFLKRAQFPRVSAANLSAQGYEKLNIQLSTRLDVCNEKCSDSNSPEVDLNESPTGCPEQFLTDIMNVNSNKFSNNSTLEKHECQNNSRTSEQIEADEIHVLEGVALIEQVENETKQGNGVFVDHCPDIERGLSVVHGSTNCAEEDSVTEVGDSVGAEQADLSDQSYHLLFESIETGKENETLTEPFPKEVQNDREAFQHRGVRRRCLQFGDAQHKIVSNQSTQITSDNEGLRLSSLETPSIPIKIPKPAGIGLHLNSIVNAVQVRPGSKVNVRSSRWGNLCIVGNKSMPVNEPHPSDYSNSTSILPLEASVSAIIDDNMHGDHASVGVTSAMSMPTYSVKPSNDSIVYNSLEDQSTLGNKRKCIENVVASEEFNKSSAPKKRMKSLELSDGDGCKRCNCRKSKCLKLYCDCFAAGIYCADPCACQGCFNKPKYEDMVLETRQKIESRDPLAFAPRVVKRVTEKPSSSLGEDVTTNYTPSSARHKRGCKCKKSMCLKKYCECYQSNVGCSDGCRCEGCQNVFGRKGDFCPTKDVFNEEHPNEAANTTLETCEMTVSGNGINHIELFDAHNLTPPTPAFQFSNHGKDASKAWFPSGEYSQSPEPDLTYMAPHMISPGSPINSDNNNNNDDPLSSENTQDILLDLTSFDHESHTPNLQKWADNSKSQPFPEKRQLYPQGGGGSLGWRGSPNTPVPQLSGTKLIRDVEFDVLLSNSFQDETPEILKDESTPANAVKVCSPNKKRVSPPHVSRQHEFGSGSLTGLRTGRKFILKAVPSFPPLTPCIDSRSVAVQQKNDRSVKK